MSFAHFFHGSCVCAHVCMCSVFFNYMYISILFMTWLFIFEEPTFLIITLQSDVPVFLLLDCAFLLFV